MESSSTTTSRLCSTSRLLLKHHFRDLDVPLRSFVKGGTDDFAFNVRCISVILPGASSMSRTMSGDLGRFVVMELDESIAASGLTGARWCIDQSPLALPMDLADRGPAGHVFLTFPLHRPGDKRLSGCRRNILLRQLQDPQNSPLRL